MTGVRTGLVALSIWLAMPSGMADTGPAAGKSLEEQIAICGGCHGEDGNSTQEGVPSLAGQPPLAVTNQLIYFRERLRQSEIMTPQAQGLEDSAIQALADHYAAQPVASPTTARDDTHMTGGKNWPPSMAAAAVTSRTTADNAKCHVSPGSGRTISSRP